MGFGNPVSTIDLVPIEIDIAHVARLARLSLEPDELETYHRQLGVILEHAAKVQALATEDQEEPGHPLGLVNAFREDRVVPSLDRDEVLAMAPETTAEHFVVPPALDGE